MDSEPAKDRVFNALEDLANEFVEANLMGARSLTRDISRFSQSRDVQRGRSSSSSSGSSAVPSGLRMIGDGGEGEDDVDFFGQ